MTATPRTPYRSPVGPDPSPDPAVVRRYLGLLIPDPEALPEGSVLAVSNTTDSGGFVTRFFPAAGGLEPVVGDVLEANRHHCVYLRMGALRGQPGYGRGTDADTIAVFGFHADVDVGDAGHKGSGGRPPTIEAALEALDAALAPEIAPTLVVASGGGLYPLWLFKEPWILDTDMERERSRHQLRRVQAHLAWHWRERGWALDSTGDLSRVLRLAGTTNRKLPGRPRPTGILRERGVRFDPDDLGDFLLQDDVLGLTVRGSVTAQAATVTLRGAFPPADLPRILEACAFMRHVRDDAVDLPEPHWAAGLTVVAACADAERWAHEFSSPYAKDARRRYSYAATRKKLGAAAKTSPVTCRHVAALDGLAFPGCATCPAKAADPALTSPVQLGRDPAGNRPAPQREPPPPSEEGVFQEAQDVRVESPPPDDGAPKLGQATPPARKGRQAGGTGAARARAPAEPVPEVAPEEGVALLGEVDSFLAKYVAFPSDEARWAVTLWAAHAHVPEAFESTPRLALLSPEKQSGKTRCLETLEVLVLGAKHAANLSVAALFRLVAEGGLTLLFDEVDVFFGNQAKEHEELRGLLNAGHRKGAVAYRCVGDPSKMEVKAFPAYCPAALAGLGELPDTILDRAVLIRMRRRAPKERVTPFRRREAAADGDRLRGRLAGWVRATADSLAAARPEMPEGLTDRPADVWEPLLAVADVAGGAWPARARAAATKLNAERQKADTSFGARLLADIRAAFAAKGVDRLTSGALVEALVAIEEAPWGALPRSGKPLDARGLARRLRPFDVAPATVRFGSGPKDTAKGYEAAWFADAFARYLPPVEKDAADEDAGWGEGQDAPAPPPEKSVTAVTGVTPREEPVTATEACDGPLRHRPPQPSHPYQEGCDGVTVVTAISGGGRHERDGGPVDADEEDGVWTF